MLVLAAADRDRIGLAARAAFPRECCGLLEGVWDGDSAHVLALHAAGNVAGPTDRFEIAPQDHFAALKAARAAGRDLIGCYHSHPNGVAQPSAHDRAGAGEEGFVWLIAALGGREANVTLNAFRYFAGGFAPMGLATGADLVTSSAKLRK